MYALFFAGLMTAAAAVPQSVTLKNAKGESIGTATITALAKGVKIKVDVKGLTPGDHAIHFHEKGSCQGPQFTSAGGHLDTAKTQHGFDSDNGPHAGDMPNLIAGSDGTAKVELVNTNVTLATLTKSGGTALVIHEKADDYKTQPSGDAGGRFACGEIK